MYKCTVVQSELPVLKQCRMTIPPMIITTLTSVTTDAAFNTASVFIM